MNTPPGEVTVPVDGGYWVWSRGCTEPGGGIVPSWGFVSTRPKVVGFGQEEILAPAKPTHSPSPWSMALATTVLGAATGWLIEEIVSVVRGKRRS